MIRMLAFSPWESGDAPAETADRSAAGNNGSANTAQKARDQVQDTPALADNDAWHDLVDSMTLDGLTKQLALHCTLQNYAGNRLNLNLRPEQGHLLTASQQEKLQAALRLRLDDKVRVEVVLEGSGDETPAQRKTRNEEEAKQAALAAVRKDPDVKQFMETFDATIDENATGYMESG